MSVKVHMTKKELEYLIEVTKAEGNDTGLLEQLLAEVTPEKPTTPASKKSEVAMELKTKHDLVTDPEEMERLRSLACPHIKNSEFWADFIARRVLVCKTCEKESPGKYGEYPQPPLF